MEVLAEAPLVVRVPSLIEAAHARELVELINSHVAAAERPSTEHVLCVAPESPHWGAAALHGLEGASWNHHGQLCAPRQAQSFHALNISDSVVLNVGDSALVTQIQHQIEAVLGLPQTHARAAQLLRYEVGVQYHAHTDCSIRLRTNDRAATVLVYLNSLSSGSTVFPSLPGGPLAVAPQEGSALAFSSVDQDGFCNQESRHWAEPPKEPGAVKYVLQQWYNVAALDGTEENTSSDGDVRPLVTCDPSGSCRRYIGFGFMHKDHADVAL